MRFIKNFIILEESFLSQQLNNLYIVIGIYKTNNKKKNIVCITRKK